MFLINDFDKVILKQPGLGSDPPNRSGREWGATHLQSLQRTKKVCSISNELKQEEGQPKIDLLIIQLDSSKFHRLFVSKLTG